MHKNVQQFMKLSRSSGIPYATYRTMKKLGPGSDRTDAKSILMYPKTDGSKKMAHRISWYLPETGISSIWIAATSDHQINIEKYATQDLPIQFITDEDNLRQCANQCSDILVHDVQALTDLPIIQNIGKTTIIDPNYQKESETGNWMRMSEKYYNEHISFPDPSFSVLKTTFANRCRSYVFAPGPSLSTVFNYDIDHSSIKFVCNDILLYEDIIEHIRPDIIVLGDSIFFSPSEYARDIRAAAATIIDEHDAYLIVPDHVVGLLYDKLGDFNNRIIGLSRSSMDGTELPSSSNEQMDTGNVVPAKMLPIASALTDKVAIIGADGYGDKANEENYHDPSVTDYKHCNISKWHPGKAHDTPACEFNQKNNTLFDKWISAGRSKGVRYYCITESNYPVLQQVKSTHEKFCT